MMEPKEQKIPSKQPGSKKPQTPQNQNQNQKPPKEFDKGIYDEFIRLKFQEILVKQSDNAHLKPEIEKRLRELESIVKEFPGNVAKKTQHFYSGDLGGRYIKVVEGYPVPEADYECTPEGLKKQLF